MGGVAEQPDIMIGTATLRPSTQEFVTPDGAQILELKVVRVLLALAKSQGQVLSRDALIDQGWDGRVVSEDAINRVMSKIRGLAGATGAFELDAIRGVGYRLRATESQASGAAAEGPSQGHAKPSVGTSRPWLLIGISAVAILIVGGLALARWRRPAQPRPTPTVSVAPLSAAAGDEVFADRLTAELRTTLSRMHGLRLIDTPSGGRPPKTDLVLDGRVDGAMAHPVLTLALHEGQSGARIWGAAFDGRAISDPSVEERAVAASAQYLAIWLGDRLSGQPTARDPGDPAVQALVAEGRQTLREAGDARLQRQWPKFFELVKQTRAISDRALALDPKAAGALMLRSEIDSWPLFPRPGETPEAFRSRREEGQRALAQALAADPDDPDVLVAAGQAATLGMRWDDAGKLLQRAVAVDPNSAGANVWYAYHLGLLGRCQEGLRYAKIAAGLQPDQAWTQMAVPRLLNCAGRQAEALTIYRHLMTQAPDNAFLVRDVYLWLLAKRDAKGIRDLVSFSRDHLWSGRPPPSVAAALNRASAGAEALDGKPGALLRDLDADHLAISAHARGESIFGRTEGDTLFPLALEYAEAGATDKAIDALRQAVEAGSLYLPWALPYGANAFPRAMREDPRFGALWRSSPGLAALMKQRSAAAQPG